MSTQIDLSKATKEQRKSYSRIMRHAGKGDRNRSWTLAFRTNFDRINWSSKGKHAS